MTAIRLEPEEVQQHTEMFDRYLSDFEENQEFTAEKIVERFDKEIKEHLNDEELETFRGVWVKLSGSDDPAAHVSEAALAKFLASQMAAPLDQVARQASSVIYRMLAHCGQLPFTKFTDKPLTFDSLLQSIIVQIPRKCPFSYGSSMEGYWTLSRGWQPADFLKQSFQAIAYPIPDSTTTRAPSFKIYPGRADKTLSDDREDFYIDITNETPEMTDLLDTISASQPGHRSQRLPREWYKPIAESFVKQSTPLDTLRIRTTDWLALVKFVLAWPSRDGSPRVKVETAEDLTKLDAEAAAILKDFEHGTDSASIDWTTWIEAMMRSHSDLLDPLRELFARLVGTEV